ncbi:hypothetical protein, partial [Stieleria sp.]
MQRRTTLRRFSTACSFAFLVVWLPGFVCLTPANIHAWEPKNEAVVAGHAFLELDAPLLTESSGLAFS